jgi:hypothetical protein
MERWERQITKFLRAIKPNGLNRIAKFGYGHLCLREENKCRFNTFMQSYFSTLLSPFFSIYKP